MPASSVVRRRLRAAVPLTVLALLCLAGLVTPGTASAAGFGQSVVDRAATYYGLPYAYGAQGPGSFDCSGFTGFVYRQFGVSLPRTAAQQYAAVAHVSQAQKELGDLIFTYDSGGVYHVGIYAGGNTMWAATHTGDVVRPQTIWTSSYYVGRPSTQGPIGQHWSDLGGSRGLLGQPLDEEHDVPGGRSVDYQGGAIYWSPLTGAHEVDGPVKQLYDARGGSAPQGLPVTDGNGTPDGIGRYNHFSSGESIYTTAATGTHEVHGLIRNEWSATGWEAGVLGYPVTDELGTPDGVGRYNHFSKDASIYFTPLTGAHEVHGPIRAAWAAAGWETGPAGYPVSDQQTTPDGVGRYTSFSKDASIYWTPVTGAHELGGVVRNAWLASGAELGPLGYPVRDEKATRTGRSAGFQHGTVTWTASTGRTVVTLS